MTMISKAVVSLNGDSISADLNLILMVPFNPIIITEPYG